MPISSSSSGSAGSGSGTTVAYGEPYSANLLSASLNIPHTNTSVNLGVRLTPGRTVQLWLSTTASANLLSSVPIRIIEGTVSFDVMAADDALAVHAFELELVTPSGAGNSSIRMVRGTSTLKLVEVRYLQGLPITPADVTTLQVPQTKPASSTEVAWKITPSYQGHANVQAPGAWAKIMEITGHTVPGAQIELNMGMVLSPAQGSSGNRRHWVEVGIFKATTAPRNPTETSGDRATVRTLVKRWTWHYTQLSRGTAPFVLAGTIYYGDIRATDTLVLQGRAMVSGSAPVNTDPDTTVTDTFVPDATLTTNTVTLIPNVTKDAPVYAYIYRAVTTGAMAPEAPTGGTYDRSTQVVVPPKYWSLQRTYDPATQTLYGTQILINPNTYNATTGLGQWQMPIQVVLKGATGTAGKDAPVYVYIYRAVKTGTMTPAAPTGGTYNTSTQVVVPPRYWSLERTYDPATQTLYGTQILINPNTHSSSSDLGQWQTPVVVLARGPAGPKGDPGDAGSPAAGTPTIPDWSATGTYVQNEVVRHNGRAFIAKRATVTQGTRSAPSGDAADADWAFFDAQDIGVWSGTEAYGSGTVRLYTTANGRTNLYQATQDVAAGTATAPAANPTVDHVKWRLVNDGDLVPRSVAYVRTPPLGDTELRIDYGSRRQTFAYGNVLFKGTVIDEAEVGMSYSTYTVSGRSQKRLTFTNLSTTQDQTVDLNGKFPFWYKKFAGTIEVIWEEYLAPTQPNASRMWVLRTVDIAAPSEQAVTANLTIGPARVAVRHGRAYRLMIRWTLLLSRYVHPIQRSQISASVGVKYTLADDTDLLSVTLANPNTTPDASRHVRGSSYARHEVVERDGILYYSLTDNNTTTPGKQPLSSFPWSMTVGASNGDGPGSEHRRRVWYGALPGSYGSFLTPRVGGHELLAFGSVQFESGTSDVGMSITGEPDFERVTWDDSGTLHTLDMAHAQVRGGGPNHNVYYIRWWGAYWFDNLHIGQTVSGHFVRVGASLWATVPSEFDKNGLEIVHGPSLPHLGTNIGHARYREGSVINVVGRGLFSARKYTGGARNVVVATMHGSEPRTVQGQSVNSLFRAIRTTTLGEGLLDNEYGIVGVAIQKQLQGTSDAWSVYILARQPGKIDGRGYRKVTIAGGKLTTPVTLTVFQTTSVFYAADGGHVTQYKTTTFTTEQTRELAKVAEGDQLTWALTSVQDNPVNFIPELAWGPLEVDGWVQEMTWLPAQKRLEYQVRAGLPAITADTPVVAGAFARLNGKLVEGKAGRVAIASTQRNHVHLSLFQTHTTPDTRVYDASHGSKSGDTLGLITRLDFTRATLREGTTNEYATAATINLSVSASLLVAPNFTQTPGAFKLVYTDAAGTTRTFLLVDAYRVTPDGSRVYQFLANTEARGNYDVDFQLPTGVIEFRVFYGTGGAGTNTEANTATKVLLNDAAGQTAVPARWVTREGLHIDTDDNFLADEYDSLDASTTTPVAYRTGKRLDAGYRGIALLWKVPSNGLGLTDSAFDGTRLVTYYFDDDPQFTTVRQTFVATAALAYGNSSTPVTYTILFRATDMLLASMPASGQSPRGTLLAMYPIL